MGAVGWLVGHELRVRWRSVVGLALLAGLTGGVVLAVAAGAQRTGSAYERFATETRTRDAVVQIDDGDVDAALDRIEALDVVARSGRTEVVPVLPTDEALVTDVDLALFSSPDGRWATEVDRPLVVEGRMPEATAAHEVLLNELAARQTGLVVGDRFTVATFTPEELLALYDGGPFRGFGGPEVELEVVGVGRQAMDLQGADVTAGGVLLVAPALQRELAGRVGAMTGLVSVELAPGATVAELRDEVRRIVGPGGHFDVRSAEEEFGASTREATRVLARALAAFAVVAAVAGAVAVGGAISRHCAIAHADARALAAVGCDRRQRRLATAAAPAAGTLLGIVVAVTGAAAASGQFPISVARRAEPHPGPRIDASVLGAGAVLAAAAAAGWLLFVLRRLDRPSVGPVGRRRTTPLPLPPVASIGVGHAFDGRSAGRPVPVRAALAAAVVGVVGIVGAATVVHSFDALTDDPARYGWAWSAEPDIYTDDPDALIGELASTDGVAAVSVRHTARVEVAGIVAEAVAFEAHHGEIEPTIRSGRLPSASDEVAVGAHTADELGASVGDRLPARTADGTGTIPVEIVGTVVNAPVESGDPAIGAVVTVEGLELLRRSDGFRALVLRYEPGFDPTALEASLRARELADFSVTYAKPRLSGGLENLDRAMPIVGALGGFFLVVALVGVGHAIVLGTRRRGRELATLRALGMRRRQVRLVVLVTALATSAVGLVVGIPLGLAVGRVAWRAVIGGQGVLDAASLPTVALAAVAPGALLVAVLVSWRPGTRAGRSPVLALRSE